MPSFDFIAFSAQLIFFAVIFILGEGVAWGLFFVLRSTMHEQEGGQPRLRAILKGIIERLMLTIGMINGFPQIIIAFGALKIATRLHDEKRDKEISNDYFLMGNFLSMLLAVLESAIFLNFQPMAMQFLLE